MGDRRYEPYMRAGDESFYLLRQDHVAPPGEFPMLRGLKVGRHMNDLNVAVDLYREPPREYPPMHFANSGAGIGLNEDQARALRDSIDGWLAARERERKATAEQARDRHGWEGDDA